MKMTASQVVMECLLEQGVDTVFGYPGGTILNIYDEFELHGYNKKIRHILTAHEQGASHAVSGYARSTGKVGVCFATGPGATNLVTGIATAYMDSSPRGVHHRQRGREPHRQGHLPGGGHHRHHPAHYQVQLPGQGRHQAGGHHPGGLRHRLQLLPRPGAD